MKKKARTR